MKRIVFSLIVALSMSTLSAQNITDALRYSDETLNGTARFNALSGAFGALGGDFSALAINPAGGAVFLRNSASASFSLSNRNNSATYFGTNNESSEGDVNINQAGAIFVFNSPYEDSKWKKFTLGINYGNTQNFDDELFIAGTGNQTIGNFFLDQAQGVPLSLLELQPNETLGDLYSFLGETQGTFAQNALLGFQGFIIDPVSGDPDNTEYTLGIAPGNFNQEFLLRSQGYNGKYTVNFATQYTDKFFFGINLNSHVIDYDQSTFLFESNENQGSSVSRIGFENNLSVLGSGFSAQFGGLMKINESFRVGLAYDTPTWYTISEETTQYLETRSNEGDQSINRIIDPGVINVFADYKLRTPGKVTGSAAYVFGEQGLISFDYSYKDYSQIKFRPTNDPLFVVQNDLISSNLKGATTYRLGGEYRIEKFSLRGGFSYAESPFENENLGGETTGYSGGLGYNFGNYTFDLSYNRTEQSRAQELLNSGLTRTANVDTSINNFVFTLGLSL